jgi:TolB-like protein
MPLRPGQTLSHYELAAEIGEGGMGVVWRARDTSLDRDVALKILPDDLVDDPERLARLQREAKTLAALNHPGIVTIHSVEEEAGIRFFTMELVQGTDLATLIPKQGFPLNDLLRVAEQVADALGAAHEADIVHRDLKPGNVMVGAGGRVKVLDFGLAQRRTPPTAGDDAASRTETLPLTKEGTVLGTAPYMSPEQVQGQVLDARSDIFSLGVMLFEMATGKRPFGGKSSAELISSILRDAPPPADELRDGLPRHLGRIIRRCLEKDPERRYQSAREVRNEIAALREELAAGPGGVRGTAEVTAAGGSRQRRNLALGVIVTVVVLAAVIVGGWIWKGAGGQAEPAAQRFDSIAVLPFQNLMNDPEQDYFVAGMHEALITNLSKIDTLRVISRTSVERYKDARISLPEIAAELGVDALVEGSVLRADGQVRITAQLIHGQTDEHLWAEDYDRELENILDLFSEVARAIAAEIEITLTPGQSELLASSGTVDPEAYEAYLRGNHHFARMRPAEFSVALPYFLKAVEVDPTFAAGWSSLSGTYTVLAFFGMKPAEEVVPLARSAAERALMLDQKNGEAHAVLGTLALYFDWDWETAALELELALELAPTNPYAHHSYADYLGVMGDLDASVRQVELGRQYDPVGLLANGVVLGHLFMAGRYEEVLTEGAKAEELFPDHHTICNFQAWALWMLGRYDESVDKHAQYLGEEHPLVKTLRSGLAEGGPELARRKNAERLVELSASASVPPHNIARDYALAGDLDSTFEWLERAFSERTPQLLHMTFDPRYEDLKSDPRYEELLRRIGFPETK